MYCRYNHDTLQSTMDNLESDHYNLDEALVPAVKKFQEALNQKEENLKKRINVFGGPSSLPCPLSQMPRSICF